MALIDPSQLSVSNDPYISGRNVRSKYDAVFEQVSVGQRLVCPAGCASRLAVQYRKWLTQRGYEDIDVKAKDSCPDGQGGVWWLAGEKKAQTRWNTPGNKAPQLKRGA